MRTRGDRHPRRTFTSARAAPTVASPCSCARTSATGPQPTPPCPAAPATVSGTLDAADVIGPAGQGIAAGEFAELLDAMRSGSTYVNIHTTTFGGGEIRAQIND